MTDLQKKLLELLTDLDAVCRRENIPYFLCGETAHAAFVSKHFHPDCCQASVAMTPKNALKFIAAVKKENRSDRITDSMYTNKGYPDFTIRYGDPNTLMLQLPYSIPSSLPCIGVTIHMICCKPKGFAAKLYPYTKLFWKACNRPASIMSRPAARLAVRLCHGIRGIFGGKYFSRWLFKRWCAMLSADKKSKKISIGTGKYSFPAELLAEEDALELEGKHFASFAYIDTYLKTAYGSDFRQKMPNYLKPSASLLISCHLTYQKYLERAKERKVDFAAISRNKAKYDALQSKVSKYNKKINKYYAIVDRTDKRFSMYEMYMPQKAQLLQMYRDGRYDELKTLLQPYYDALEDCYRKKLGLCFDKEVFDLAMELLLQEDRYTYVHKLRALVPRQHWEPMVITNYKGEPV